MKNIVFLYTIANYFEHTHDKFYWTYHGNLIAHIMEFLIVDSMENFFAMAIEYFPIIIIIIALSTLHCNTLPSYRII